MVSLYWKLISLHRGDPDRTILLSFGIILLDSTSNGRPAQDCYLTLESVENTFCFVIPLGRLAS